MTLAAATPELVGQQVGEVLRQRPDAEIIALRAEPRWAGGTLLIDGRTVRVEPCASPLAVRVVLAEREASGEGSDLLVLLCDLAESELGSDVLARLTPARVLGLDPWSAAKSLFGVRHLDSAFGKDDGWIADALLTYVSGPIARSLTGGAVLTIDVALDALATVLFGADALQVDALLSSAANPAKLKAFEKLPAPVREGMLGALRRRLGALGSVIASVLAAERGEQLLSLGLASRAVYGDGQHDGGIAAGRLETRFGGVRIAPPVGAALAQRCEEVVTTLLRDDLDRANGVIAEADRVALEVEAPHLEDSDILTKGFDRRVAIAAGLVATAVDALPAPSEPLPALVSEALEGSAAAIARARRHWLRDMPGGRSRLDHLEMAARLSAWLTTPTTATSSFEESAAAYGSTSSWVDRARRRLWHGDADPEVGATYRRVLDRVVARRRVENERFAKQLAAWTSTLSSQETRASARLVTVEDVASRVLAPLGSVAPLLFVVLDGCGLPSFTELSPQLRETGYREVVRSSSGTGAGILPGLTRLTGVAALPTVTEVSRASLIAGRLDRGGQEHERRAFAANSTLAIRGEQAAFFHQSRLLGAAGSQLAAEVETAISSGPAIVGVVINTIDDHLKRGTFAEELRLGDLHGLVALLESSRTHGRTVVISADHGHVLAQPDDGGTGAFQGGGTGGERWRTANRPPSENEVLLRGERVLLGGDAGVIAPFDDDFRYGAKAGGYHGGATPEEVLVPVAVFTPAGVDPPPGWEPSTQVPPLWWDLLLPSDVPVGPSSTGGGEAVKTKTRKSKPVDESQTAMFDVPTPAPTAPSLGSAGAEPVWLSTLLSTDVWKLQKGAAGRAQLPDDRVRSVLASLVRRGGVASFAAIAADTGLPAGRLAGFLTHLARVLNVEGYAVLDVDAAGAEVRLSLPLLAQQFEIALDPG